ncbi:MAG: decaprenyl-phosphate phosphoribosyltransferase [bacterium]
MFCGLILSLRPKQWTKNLLLFAGLIFSKNVLVPALLWKASAAFFLFCLLSGSVYLINDVADVESDRNHPLKKDRAIASGRVPIGLAVGAALIVAAGALGSAFLLGNKFGMVAAGYFILILAYSFVLKHVIIMDVLAIALGFVLRAAAGAVVIAVPISSWLLLCTIFAALFLAMSKRRHEMLLLGDNSTSHRKTLGEYSAQLLDQMVPVVTASTVMSYALYTTSAETVAKFGTNNLVFTVPFVLFGIFRYLYLVHQKNSGGNPEIVLLTDLPTIVNLVFYALAVGLILYH